jgi:hypothetical protein
MALEYLDLDLVDPLPDLFNATTIPSGKLRETAALPIKALNHVAPRRVGQFLAASFQVPSRSNRFKEGFDGAVDVAVPIAALVRLIRRRGAGQDNRESLSQWRLSGLGSRRLWRLPRHTRQWL